MILNKEIDAKKRAIKKATTRFKGLDTRLEIKFELSVVEKMCLASIRGESTS